MDDAKRTVLAAALSTYAELLAKNSVELRLEQRKGKGKVLGYDMDLTAEVQSQLKLCVELNDSIASATSGKDIARTFELAEVTSKPPKNEHESWEELEEASDESFTTSKSQTGNDWQTDPFQDPHPSTVASDQQTRLSFQKLQQSYVVDNEPYINPFTGLPVIPETGYEPGPSSRPPAPLQELSLQPTAPTRAPSILVKPTREPPELSQLSSHSLRLPPGPSSKVPIRPPKPPHLRAPPIVHTQPTLARPATLPSQRPTASPPQGPTLSPPLWATKPQQLQRELVAPATPPEYSLPQESSGTRKPAATEEQANILPSQVYRPLAITSSTSLYEQPSIPLPSPFDWVTGIPDSREGASRDEEHVTSLAHKSKYLHHIATLASKALKATGSMISAMPTPPVYQSQSLCPQETANMPVPPVEPADYTLVAGNTIGQVPTKKPVGSSWQKALQEILPPAYGIQSHTSGRSSSASISSATKSSVRVSPPTSSRTSVLSPASPSASSSSDDQHNGTRTASPSIDSSTGFSPGFQTLHKCIPNLPSANSSQESVSSPLSSSITPGAKRIGTWTPSARPPLTPPAVSLEAKGCPGRRYTAGSASNRPVTLGTFPDDQAATDATFTKIPHLNDTNPIAQEPLSILSLAPPGISPSLDQQTSYVQKQRSATGPPLNPPGSNSPWKDHLAADEALAKRLQQEEYQDIQMERDQLLAYSIANGTAADGDVNLAYFMSRETATLIASTEAATTSSHNPGAWADTSLNTWDMGRETLQMQLDLLEARKLETELRAQDTADEASASEAKRLQAKFDKEVQDEEAWEDWKKGNIEECIVCGDEHLGEELVRPCEHGYCDGCLQDGFKNALASKAPFKCCKKALGIEGCPGLSTEFVAEYEEMMLELSTPNPMYCCNAQCAKFLAPRAIVGDIGTCSRCRSQTCRHCRRRTHPGTFCVEDKETEAVKGLAKVKGWKTCPGCNHLIERQSGCLHMICSRCQTAFCYRCSKPWKDCESTCPDR
ncbi:MAG: hypothetical protein M1813_000772 [Trichoglossum hirsutum]|nr:MAG: hypothetical protein M1813_000772 [Trichoglossum hirsutum]